MITLSINQLRSARCIRRFLDARIEQLRIRQPGVTDDEPLPLAVWSEVPNWPGGTRCPTRDIPGLACCAGSAAIKAVRAWAVECAERALARWAQIDSDHQLRQVLDLAVSHMRDGTEVSPALGWELLDLSRARANSGFGACTDAVRHALACASEADILVAIHATDAAFAAQAAVESDAVEESWQRARLLELLS